MKATKHRSWTGRSNIGWSAMLCLLTSGQLLAINRGELDANNDFPNVGALVALEIPNSFAGLGLTPPQSFSSGTLIHPRVVLTAGHSVGFMHFLMAVDGLELSDFAVSFSPDGHDGTMELPITAAIPMGLAFPPNNTARPDTFPDVGVIILAEPVAGIDPVKLPEVELLSEPLAHLDLAGASANEALVVVGYGAIDPDRPATGFLRPSGLRSYAPVQFQALRSNYLLGLQNLAQDAGGPEGGDSGGPLFWEFDGERVQIGIVSGGDPVSAGFNIYQRTDTPEVRQFIETILALVELGAL